MADAVDFQFDLFSPVALGLSRSARKTFWTGFPTLSGETFRGKD